MNATASIRRSLGISALMVALMGALGLTVWVWQGIRPGQFARQANDLEGLQIFGTLPDFSLMERSGQRIALADLRGKVWIANFIYTHCTDTCPLQSAEMARLQTDLAQEADLRLVSITVDPAQDTPGVLAEYAARFGADRDRWLFLTGTKRALYALTQEGFHLSVEGPDEAIPAPPGKSSPPRRSRPSQTQSLSPQEAPGSQATRILHDALDWLFEPASALAHPGHLSTPFLHSSWFVLVDRQARIRGYYKSEDQDALKRLRRDSKTLLREDRT